MPHPGAHISVVQALAASTDPADAAIAALFGNAQTNIAGGGANADAVLRNRYACLGAVGPDLLYFLLDGSDRQIDTQNTIIRLYSTFQALDDIAAEFTKLSDTARTWGDKIMCPNVLGHGHDTIKTIFGTAIDVVQTLAVQRAGLWVDKKGLNLFALLDSPRQKGDAPTAWYWADHLHYYRTGKFTRNLLDLAMLDPKYKGEPALAAYAAGYFTHYVADTIGHPYVNAIVGGPYRLHRQRHTLVENFIDNVVWRSSFVSGQAGPKPFNPLTGQPWVDAVRTEKTPKGAKPSSFWRSRVHQMIDVGGAATSLNNDVSGFLSDVAGKIGDVNAKFSVKSIDFTPDPLFDKWCDLLVEALRKTYDQPGVAHPTLVNPDAKGFLKRGDIKTAYVACYALLKMSTTPSMGEPVPPDFSKVSDALKEAWDNLKKNAGKALDKIFSTPKIPSGSSFSLSAAWDALTEWVRQVLEGVIELIKAAWELVKDLCNGLNELITQVMQLAIWSVQTGLFAAYSAVRRMLELRAYAQPMDETVSLLPQLWQPGGGGMSIRGRGYPEMERKEALRLKPFSLELTAYSQEQLFCQIEPVLHPSQDKPTGVEQPAIVDVMVHPPKTGNPLFELFWAQPAANDASNMFSSADKVTKVKVGSSTGPQSFNQVQGLDFGGIVPNCRTGLRTILKNAAAPGATSVETKDFTLPDYNLDGDRGGGFPAWKLVGGSYRTDAGVATISLDIWE